MGKSSRVVIGTLWIIIAPFFWFGWNFTSSPFADRNNGLEDNLLVWMLPGIALIGFQLLKDEHYDPKAKTQWKKIGLILLGTALAYYFVTVIFQ